MYRLRRRRLGDTSRRRRYVKPIQKRYELPVRQLFTPAYRVWNPVSQRSSLRVEEIRGRMVIMPNNSYGRGFGSIFRQSWFRRDRIVRLVYDDMTPTNVSVTYNAGTSNFSSGHCLNCGRSCGCNTAW